MVDTVERTNLEELLLRSKTYGVELGDNAESQLRGIPDNRWDSFIDRTLDEVFGLFDVELNIDTTTGEVTAPDLDPETVRVLGEKAGITVDYLDPVVLGYASALLELAYEESE